MLQNVHIPNKCHYLRTHSRETWRYLIQISRISPFALWVTSDIWLVTFNSLTPVVTEFTVKIAKSYILTVYHSSFRQYILNVKLWVMQAVIAYYIFNKKGGSIPVCTDRKATGLYVLACFLSATMSQNWHKINLFLIWCINSSNFSVECKELTFSRF